jgi:hypothetical protein
MPDNFDAYFKWLGIPPEEQPPNHYRLLAIPLLVDDATVIEHAADQRMAHLRSFQTGKHSALSQRLLNEVSAARVCLLNPKKKAAYDDQLRQALQAQQAAGADVAGLEIDLGQAPTGVSRSSAAKPAVPPMAWIAGGGAGAAGLGGVVGDAEGPFRRSTKFRRGRSAGFQEGLPKFGPLQSRRLEERRLGVRSASSAAAREANTSVPAGNSPTGRSVAARSFLANRPRNVFGGQHGQRKLRPGRKACETYRGEGIAPFHRANRENPSPPDRRAEAVDRHHQRSL